MSMSPMLSRPWHERPAAAVEVLAWTFWPMRVRLKPSATVFSVFGESTWRYSPVKNWLRERKFARELRIVGRQELVGVVERVAREELVAGAEVVVDAALHEVLVERLIERERVGRRAPGRATARWRAGTRRGTARPPG